MTLVDADRDAQAGRDGWRMRALMDRDDWTGHAGWGFPGAGLVLLLVLTAVIVAVVVMSQRSGAVGASESDRARRILDERFARGEVDEQEYHARRSALHAP